MKPDLKIWWRQPWQASRRVQTTRVVALGVLAAYFTCVLIGTWRGFPPDVRLAGAEHRVAAPRLTWRTWFDGSYAAAVEPWLTQNLGWRGLGIRTANQINYSLFRRVPTSLGTPITIGADYWLYEQAYISERMRRSALREDVAQKFAQDLKRLQSICQAHNTAFTLLITPSKAEIYPEHLPKDFRQLPPATAARTNAYQQIVAALQGTGVTCMDAHAAFLAWKEESVDLFPPGGTHWNQYGVQRTLHQLWQKVRQQPGGAKLDQLPNLSGYEWRAPMGTDQDLSRLLNLWRFEPGGARPVPFPVLDDSAAPKAPVKIVIIGDSFAFTLMDALARTGLPGAVDLFYYCRRHYRVDLPGLRHEQAERIDHGSIAFEELVKHPRLLEADLLILEFNEIFANITGWGFPAAVATRCKDSEIFCVPTEHSHNNQSVLDIKMPPVEERTSSVE